MSDYAPGIVTVHAAPESPNELEAARLARLRPADRSARAIKVALEEVTLQKANVAARLASAKARSEERLLHGQVPEILQARKAEDDAQVRLDQLEAMGYSLTVSLDRAITAEVAAASEIADAVARAEALVAKFRHFVDNAYAKHAAAIAAGLALEAEAQRAVEVVRQMVAAWPGVDAPPQPLMPRVPEGPYIGRSFGNDACLPGTGVRPRASAATAHAANG